MENTVVALLMLCAVSGVTLQDSAITGKAGASSDIENASQCLSDTGVLLRDLSVQQAKNTMLIEQLQRLLQERQVAFSASLQSIGVTGPFNSHTTLVFKNVVSNIGNGYNSETGVFTAPVRGAYHFEFFIYANGGKSTAAVLVKNGQHIFAVNEHQSSGQSNAGNAANLQLEVGDVVSVQLWMENIVFDNEKRYNTFSGHLMFPM